MKTKTTAPAAEPSVDDAERQVAQRNDELISIRTEIATKEASLLALALGKRYRVRGGVAGGRTPEAACVRRVGLAAARETLARAKARDEQDRRRGLYEAGTKAAAEIERLAGEYERQALAIAKTFFAIEAQRAAIEAANKSLPDGERIIDSADYALRINYSAKLPAAREGSEAPWAIDGYGYGKLDPRPQGRIPYFNESLERPTTPTAPQPVPQQARRPDDHVKTRHDGGLVYKVPPVQWPRGSRIHLRNLKNEKYEIHAG
jgi:hypothetical protein